MPGPHFRRERPPWWPTDEPWPPAAPPWRAARGRFFRRMGCLFGLFFFLSVAVCALLFWLIGAALGFVTVPASAFPWVQPVGFVALVIGAGALVFAGRALRRTAVPIGDMMDAARRVADGDYSARVRERGPREVRSLARAFNSMAQRLQTTDEQRRNLLADVTHELRTPLTVIQGNLEGLIDGVYPADEAHLKSILDETRILSRLIDDLRTLALAESGALVLQKEPTDFAMLVAETVSSFQGQADAASVALSAECAPDLPLLDVDPARMREVLANLIANALRYTPHGGEIRVRCSLGKGGKQVVVAVEDTGAGIAADELPHIFDRFYRARDSRGMGLGLAIAKNLVTAHGGEIHAESEPGQGTTIHFSLPTPA
jgi:two-component system OmpR family sensor kinase/two-component system sensor histidine kinase BaeS